MSDWIRVEDELPKDKQQILVWYKYTQLPYDTCIAVSVFRGEFNNLISHWSPLPPPPEKLSNCCSAPPIPETDMCSECKEHAGFE